jgi:hypothetical protein
MFMNNVFDLRLVTGPRGFLGAVESLSAFLARDLEAWSDTDLPDDTYTVMVQSLPETTVRPVYLWMIQVTLEIRTPTHWWREAETYFRDIQWIRANDATENRLLTQSNFEEPVPPGVLALLNEHAQNKDRERLRRLLPDSFVRRAYVQTDYLTLRRSYHERLRYHSGHWRRYCESLTELPYNRLLTEGNRGKL